MPNLNSQDIDGLVDAVDLMRDNLGDDDDVPSCFCWRQLAHRTSVIRKVSFAEARQLVLAEVAARSVLLSFRLDSVFGSWVMTATLFFPRRPFHKYTVDFSSFGYLAEFLKAQKVPTSVTSLRMNVRGEFISIGSGGYVHVTAFRVGRYALFTVDGGLELATFSFADDYTKSLVHVLAPALLGFTLTRRDIQVLGRAMTFCRLTPIANKVSDQFKLSNGKTYFMRFVEMAAVSLQHPKPEQCGRCTACHDNLGEEDG